MAVSKIVMERVAESSKATLKQVHPEPLENGERISRDEFEWRYQAMPRIKKAELIKGVVFMPSPVRLDDHGEPHAWVIGWLTYYAAFTPGVRLGDNTTVRLAAIHEPQPDAMLLIDESLGGRSRVGKEGYVENAPELIVEIAASSRSFDLHDKKDAYLRNGVKEYVVWSVHDGEVNWFRLQRGKYVKAKAGAEGIIRSRTFPGLWLNIPALLAGKMAGVFDTLQAGLQSKEQADFIKRLAKRIKAK